VASASAQEVSLEPGEGSIQTRLGLLHKIDDGGNPFYDESLTVIEPAVVMDYRLNDKWSVGTDLLIDHVSSASIERLGDRSVYPNTQQSGASGDYYVGANFRGRRHLDEHESIGALLGFSAEYDYSSFAFGGDYSLEQDDQSSSLSMGLSGFYDTLEIIRWDGTQSEPDDTRFSVAANVSWYQALAPSTHGTFGLTHTEQSGFLETPFNAIILLDPSNDPNPALEGNVRGIEASEELPDARGRDALYGRVRHYVAENTSVELGGRYYFDTWGIAAWSIEPRWYRSLDDDRTHLRLRYRYYDQTPADYWSETFTGTDPSDAPEFRTQDPELGDFQSHTVGGMVSWTKESGGRFDVSLDLVLRSDDTTYVMASFGWGRKF
jgi:hypothetical protein